MKFFQFQNTSRSRKDLLVISTSSLSLLMGKNQYTHTISACPVVKIFLPTRIEKENIEMLFPLPTKRIFNKCTKASPFYPAFYFYTTVKHCNSKFTGLSPLSKVTGI